MCTCAQNQGNRVQPCTKSGIRVQQCTILGICTRAQKRVTKKIGCSTPKAPINIVITVVIIFFLQSSSQLWSALAVGSTDNNNIT